MIDGAMNQAKKHKIIKILKKDKKEKKVNNKKN